MIPTPQVESDIVPAVAPPTDWAIATPDEAVERAKRINTWGVRGDEVADVQVTSAGDLGLVLGGWSDPPWAALAPEHPVFVVYLYGQENQFKPGHSRMDAPPPVGANTLMVVLESGGQMRMVHATNDARASNGLLSGWAIS